MLRASWAVGLARWGSASRAAPRPRARACAAAARRPRARVLRRGAIGLAMAARLLARRFDRVFAPLGITNGQFSMMVALTGQWRPKLSELAQFLAMDQATMTAASR